MLRIREFFANKNVLITGGTGLVGVSLVEKLLRAFPEIGSINLVVRRKNGESLGQRSSNYFSLDAFDCLKRSNVDLTSKIVWLEGDISEPNLGLSEDSLKHISDTVNVIYHAAATVRFVEPLKNAINLNLCGTNEVFKIAKRCTNLNCFMHVSTAFINHRFSRSSIQDRSYEMSQDPLDLIRMHDTLTKDEIEVKAKTYLKDWPNTYIYTKNAAENLLYKNNTDMKIGIFRPGSISEAYQEPYPYWMINCSAFSAILRKAHTGLMFNLNPKAKGNMIPIDLSTNALIAATCDAANIKEKTKFYTLITNKPTWFEQYHMYIKNIKDPWLMFGSLKYRFLSHMKDLVLEMNGRKGIYVKEIQRHEKMMQLMEHFMYKEFQFESKNIDDLWESMDQEERKLLFFDFSQVDWQSYFENMYHANKKHLVDMMDYKPTLKALTTL
ncbi:PREDICTED: fatty acyl-CoA reductase 1-like [Nicrophorus vespilloides]|uniref:Fatty acyl-CoA reductase n=1 Tax=Nicrophorus vespilloides TaxID=110193 RepID=A0ABM1MNV7_NICVS|nr:PREDICTED: fatty acyl-CoA reductase 1-like [Nicrophorus vespilloides]